MILNKNIFNNIKKLIQKLRYFQGLVNVNRGLIVSSLIITLLFAACEPEVDDKPDIGAPPNPTFEILQGDTPNNFILMNTTEGAFLTHWNLGANGQREGNEVEVTYPFMGNYDVIMTTFNKGGSASATQSLTVTQDDPNACYGNVELLTDCTEKVWKIAPEEGALFVGPSVNDNAWWSNSADDVNDRSCHFNDEFIFRENGEFEYKSNGDFWADSDGDGNVYPPDLAIEVGCHPNTDWPSAYQTWDSGVHNFSVTNTTITVSGEGAWLGLYKIGTSGDVLVPQQSVTFKILSIDDARMVIYADYGSQVWKITMVAL